MGDSVIILGASGHGKVVADIVQKSGDTIVGFLDDDTTLPETFSGFPVLGVIGDYTQYLDCKFVIAIGNALAREKIAERMDGVSWYTAIHPSAVISGFDVTIEAGTVVMANTVINSGSKIGRHCIINSGAIVEHDNMIEDYVHVSVGAKLAGTVHVGTRSWIGVGAAVSNNLSITQDCMIGAGAVVVRNIDHPGTYVGVPARRISA